MVSYSEGEFECGKYDRIYYQSWLPQGDIKAVVLLAHGLSEHSGRYATLVEYLTTLGYAVYSWDHPGHGRSSGKRKHIDQFSDFTDVMSRYFQHVKQQQPELPIYLIGHSMGGLISASYLLEHQSDFAGVVFSSPAFEVVGGLSSFTLMGGRVLSALLPNLGFESLKDEFVCRDPNVRELKLQDPLFNHGKTSIRLLVEMADEMLRVKEEAHTLAVPMLLMQGTDDRIEDPAGTSRLHELASSEDKTLETYEDFYHELFNDPEKERVFADLSGWLEVRVES